MWCRAQAQAVIDRAISAGAFVSLCIPGFAIGILLLYVFAVELGGSPRSARVRASSTGCGT